MAESPQTLETLPAEILSRICECLYHGDYVASLAAFASASKLCYSPASGILARTIKFSITDDSEFPGNLPRDIELCHDALLRDGNLAQVRRLVVQGEPPGPQSSGASYGMKSRKPGRHRYEWKRPRISAAERTDDETALDGYWKEGRDARTDEQELELSRNKTPDSFWEPLAEFIKKLSGLTDLFYACPTQLSPCLLEALHQYHPRCRLHMRNFHLRSILNENLDPHELKLASSPCLYSIRCAYAKDSTDRMEAVWGPEGEPKENNFQNAAVMRLLTRLAPALKQVHLRFPPSESPDPFPSQPWRALDTSNLPLSPGSLHCIEMDWFDPMNSKPLETWSACTDFSVLRVLKISSALTLDGIQLLATCSFPSLISLVIVLEEGMAKDYYDLATRFLHGLSSQLVTLRIGAWVPPVALSSVLGRNLRTLDLRTYGSRPLRLSDVVEISTRCPRVEDLSLPVNRSKGDAAEGAVYRALGRLPRLRKLALRLTVRLPMLRPQTIFELRNAVTYWRSTLWDRDSEELNDEEDENDEDEEDAWIDDDKLPYAPFKRRHLRDLFINVALDDALALAIFKVVSTEKERLQHATLETLDLEVDGWEYFRLKRHMQLRLDEYCKELGRPWTVKRNPRWDHRSELIVQKRSDPAADWRLMYPSDVERSRLHPVFRALWPHSGDGRERFESWREDWRSFPLRLDE